MPTFIDDMTVLCLNARPFNRNVLRDGSIFSAYTRQPCDANQWQTISSEQFELLTYMPT